MIIQILNSLPSDYLKIDFVLQYTPNIQKVNADCTMFAFFVIIV